MQPQICVYYDAWENDNDEDPMLSLVYNIMKSVNVDFSLQESSGYIQLGASVLELFTGKSFSQVIETLRSEDFFMEQKRQKDIHEKIDEFLNNIWVHSPLLAA